MLIDVERALEAIESGEERLAGARDEPAGTLRVSAPIAFGRRFVVPVIGDLARRYPRLAVCLELDDRLVDLVGEGLDVAIRIGGLSDSSAMMRKLTDNCRILVASPAYLDAAGRPATPEEAAGHIFLRYGTSAEPWHLRGPGGETANLAATGRLRVDDGDTVHDWGLGGLGIMLKSQVDVAADLSAGRLERVLPGWDGGAAPIVALYPSGRNLPLKTRVLLDALERQVAEALGNKSKPSTPHPSSAAHPSAESTAAQMSAFRRS